MTENEREVLLRRINWETVGRIAYFLENFEEGFGYVKPQDAPDLNAWAEYLRQIERDVGA